MGGLKFIKNRAVSPALCMLKTSSSGSVMAMTVGLVGWGGGLRGADSPEFVPANPLCPERVPG